MIEAVTNVRDFQNSKRLPELNLQVIEKSAKPASAARPRTRPATCCCSRRTWAPTHPHWYRNIEDDPHVTVEVTGASWDAVAEILDGDERADAASGMPMASHAERARLNVTRAIEPDARLPIPQLGSWVLTGCHLALDI